MTNKEKILRDQIKELERLVSIKDAVIAELKTLIRPTYTYPYPYYISSGTVSATSTEVPNVFVADQSE